MICKIPVSGTVLAFNLSIDEPITCFKTRRYLIMAELTSPMTGRIQEINVKVGQMITEDDELFVIEAMKMESAVYGDPGVVKEIFVKVGDKVEEDDPLAVIE